VVQETTTLVRQAPSEYVFAAEDAPGFLLESVTHAPGGAWDAAAQAWRFVAHFHAPAGRVHVLFATRRRAGAAPAEHACEVATDVCCLHRMAADHDLGEFGAWVATNLSPLCSAPGGLPDAATAGLASEAVLAGLPRAAWLGPLAGATVTAAGPGRLQLEASQGAVRDELAAETALADGARFAFAFGMLFLQPLPVPALFAAVGQARVEVVARSAVSFVATSEQEYSFLEYLDVALHEVLWRPPGAPPRRPQFARVSFVLPAAFAGGARVPPDSIEFALAADAAAVAAWTAPCAGAGGYDLAEYGAALGQACAPGGGSLCNASRAAADDYLYVLDVPLGDAALVPGALFLRFLVGAARDVAGVPQEALTRADLQIAVDETTRLRACGDALASEVRDAEYVGVSVGVGVQLAPIAGDPRDTVVFSSVTATVDYATLRAFDLGARYAAVSILDSIITLAAQGEPAFFEAPAQAAAAVVFDDVLVVHVRSDAKYAAAAALVAAGAAHVAAPNAAGFWQITLSEAFLAACGGASAAPDGALDCAVQHPVADRAVASPLAHLVSADDAGADVAWLLGLLGSGDLAADTAAALAANTNATFGLNARYRRALWLVPAFAWPGADALGTADRALVFVAFAVVR
jgi:hypothetical protein